MASTTTHLRDPVKRTTSKAKPARRKGAVLTLVARPRASAKHKSTTPAPAIAGPIKQQILFNLRRSFAMVHAALRGLSAEAAERPMGKGKWNARETVLHLCTRDRARLREMEAALRGVSGSWMHLGDQQMSRVNAETLAPLRHLMWSDVIALFDSTRQLLLEAIESVPDEPAEVWSEDHAFGWMFHRLPSHDIHHAEVIQQWRAAQGV